MLPKNPSFAQKNPFCTTPPLFLTKNSHIFYPKTNEGIGNFTKKTHFLPKKHPFLQKRPGFFLPKRLQNFTKHRFAIFKKTYQNNAFDTKKPHMLPKKAYAPPKCLNVSDNFAKNPMKNAPQSPILSDKSWPKVLFFSQKTSQTSVCFPTKDAAPSAFDEEVSNNKDDNTATAPALVKIGKKQFPVFVEPGGWLETDRETCYHV